MTRHAREFHEAFDLDRPAYPTVPSAALASLRLRLIKEEVKETDDEFQVLLRMLRSTTGTVDQKVAVMQALVKELCDIKYVVDGALVAFGVSDDAYDEVHRSNMSKLGEDGKPLRRADGKVLKGPYYSEADPDKMFPPVINIPEEDITDELQP
jgi:predicted HAD superfamily Cof-like phosphohydrolase